MEVRLVALLCLLVVTVIRAKNVNSKPGAFEDTYGNPIGDDEEDIQNDYIDENYGSTDDETGDILEEPKEITGEFISTPQVFVASIGEVVRLPCQITNPDVVITWKKDDRELLYQGETALKDYSNIKKTSDALEVNVTSENDLGSYTCQMQLSTNNTPKITHRVVKPGPPKIISIQSADNRTVYSIGESFELACIVQGFPKPKISWHKGSERIEPAGENLTITNLKPHNAGIYRCLADNNIAPLAHGHIEIHVEHKPVVSVDKYIVNSNHEKDAELKCTVHAYPVPVVVWKKDGMNVVAYPPKIVLKRHQNNVENVLMITNLTDSDFGKYTCSATNKFGKVEKTVTLVKIPVVREFVKPEKANRDVVLTWKVESKSPVIEHQLQYRKKGDEEWKNLDPEVSSDGNDVYTLKYTLTGLEPGSYETRARSQNSHGWSDYSEIMPFEGVLAKSGSHHKSHHKKHPKEKALKEKQAGTTTSTLATPALQQENESAVGASEISGCSLATSSIYLTSTALLILLHRQ